METKETIEILFKEYDTLRAEVRDHTGNQFNLLGAFGALLVWFLPRLLQHDAWKAFAVVVLVFLLIRWVLIQNIKRCAYRLVELEEQINHLAGENLLQWETRWGGSRIGWFRSKPPGYSPKI
jgi:low affinity Fe/Cu permease